MENHQSSNLLEKYHIIKELGRDDQGIYINYLAQNNFNNQQVILTDLISPLPFSETTKNIDYQQILTLLQSLNHEGIPRHLHCFESIHGFCLVQEYPQTQPVTLTNKLTWEEIKKIVISTLDIFIYLQEQNFPIFHNQICLNNLLIDSNFQVYLINFGFAKLENLNCPFYSIMNINKGFIPPEQKRGKDPTKNSDLYSFGVTLACLITDTKNDQINNLIGQDGTFNLLGLISNQMSLTWIEWLENIVAINPQHRYIDAITALDVIKNVDIIRNPDVKFTPNLLDLKAHNYGEIITQNITIINPVTDTNLVGKWEVLPSKYDIMLDHNHPWITFKPKKFEGNKIECQIIINTNKLKAHKIYKRKLVIKANSGEKNHILPLRLETASIKSKNLLYGSLILLFFTALICGWLSGIMVNFTPNIINWLTFILGLIVGSIGGYGASFAKIDWFIKAVGAIFSLIIIVGFVGLSTDLDLIIGFIASLIITCIAGMMIKFYGEKNCPKITTFILALLTAIFGISLGINFSFMNTNSFLLLLIISTGFPLILILINPYWQYQKQLNNYRRQEKSLINS